MGKNNITFHMFKHVQTPSLFIAAMDPAYIRWLREVRQEESKANLIIQKRNELRLRTELENDAKRNASRQSEHEKIARVLDQADRAILETQQEQETVPQELDNVKEIIDKHIVSCFPFIWGAQSYLFLCFSILKTRRMCL